MICNGILPIDQMRDHVPPVSLVCQRIPHPLLEATYGIRITKPREGEDPDRVPYAHELLEAYGCELERERESELIILVSSHRHARFHDTAR